MAKPAAKKPTTAVKKPPAPAKPSRPGVDTDSGELSRFISLASGTSAYVCYPRGFSHRVRTSSAEFDALVAQMTDAGLGVRVRHELTGLATRQPSSSWPDVLARLDAADAFGLATVNA